MATRKRELGPSQRAAHIVKTSPELVSALEATPDPIAPPAEPVVTIVARVAESVAAELRAQSDGNLSEAIRAALARAIHASIRRH